MTGGLERLPSGRRGHTLNRNRARPGRSAITVRDSGLAPTSHTTQSTLKRARYVPDRERLLRLQTYLYNSRPPSMRTGPCAS